MARKMYGALALALSVFTVSSLSAQEALKSAEEEYYDFLAVQGKAERGFLNYRTLSDSVWTLEGEAAEGSHVWAGNNLGTRFLLWQPAVPAENAFARGLDQGIALRVYGPEWFNSFNTHAPYGQNDGGLWQGKGYNTSLSAGARLEAYGFELTVKPQLSFSQNAAFDLLPSGYDSPYGYFWGYGGNKGIDAPQRFGNRAFWNFDWGDTEIRWSWHGLTVGFGTQAVWLGPAHAFPILHSNNAGGYPKLDIGLRRTAVTIPWIDWYAGDIEARIWTGCLTESGYFDNDASNDRNMIHGLTFSYAPSFAPGLVLSANRVCLVKWDWANLKYIVPLAENTHVGEHGAGEDQKMSVSFRWTFPQVGFELYGEIGKDDFSNYKIPNPMHTLVYTAGLKKTFTFSEKHRVYGELVFELSNMEMSQDFQWQWPYSFYFHHQVTQGYTNRGQILGNGWNPGGNAQFLGLNVYYPRGKTLVFLQRTNPDNNFIHKDSIKTTEGENDQPSKRSKYRTWFAAGVSSDFFVTKDFRIFGGVQIIDVSFPFYYFDDLQEENRYTHFSWMFHFEFGCKWNF